ncbi:Uncharacterised protein [Candidatus Gugararchaeum adminiculabundum]|nr:Uncharacterised protein [Candidatus Gugararchaeum adminiculabundum]
MKTATSSFLYNQLRVAYLGTARAAHRLWKVGGPLSRQERSAYESFVHGPESEAARSVIKRSVMQWKLQQKRADFERRLKAFSKAKFGEGEPNLKRCLEWPNNSPPAVWEALNDTPPALFSKALLEVTEPYDVSSEECMKLLGIERNKSYSIDMACALLGISKKALVHEEQYRIAREEWNSRQRERGEMELQGCEEVKKPKFPGDFEDEKNFLTGWEIAVIYAVRKHYLEKKHAIGVREFFARLGVDLDPREKAKFTTFMNDNAGQVSLTPMLFDFKKLQVEISGEEVCVPHIRLDVKMSREWNSNTEILFSEESAQALFDAPPYVRKKFLEQIFKPKPELLPGADGGKFFQKRGQLELFPEEVKVGKKIEVVPGRGGAVTGAYFFEKIFGPETVNGTNRSALITFMVKTTGASSWYRTGDRIKYNLEAGIYSMEIFGVRFDVQISGHYFHRTVRFDPTQVDALAARIHKEEEPKRTEILDELWRLIKVMRYQI